MLCFYQTGETVDVSDALVGGCVHVCVFWQMLDVKSVVEVDAKGDLEERKWEQGRGKFGPSQWT